VNIFKSGDTRSGGGDREMLIAQLAAVTEEGRGGLYWPGPQQLPVHTPQITMEIYISDWIHKFQNKTGLDAKANLELYKSKQVCSVRRYDMNGIFQMQGGKNWILPKYVDQCKPVLLGLSLAGNLVKQLLSLYGTEWSERGYGLCEERNISVWDAERIEY
jgi:hypothetical protein